MIKTLVILRCEPHRLLSFGASRTGFYPSVRAAQAFIFRYEPHRLLSFGASRTGFYLLLKVRSRFGKFWILNFKLGTSCKLAPAGGLSFGASRTGFYLSSHTRLRQLADFPSLNLRSSFAEGSLKVWGILNFEFWIGHKLQACASGGLFCYLGFTNVKIEPF